MKRAIAALLLAMAGAMWFGIHQLGQPYGAFPAGGVIVEVPKGTGSRHLAALLESKGVVRSAWLFLAARATRPGAKLQAGEYNFSSPADVWHVFDRISRGDVYLHELLIPEGSNLFDIAEAVGKLGFVKQEEFKRVASDPSPIRDLDPQARTLEGYLFPSTYRLSRNTTAAQICKLMTDQFRQVWKNLDTEGSTSVHETVTLASLVEKETGQGEDRPLVASVFRNRLNLGMKLECDPTTIYAALLENRYRGKIYRSDLDNPHPYNTYQNAGLPPGPIASPGEASLKAALRPAQSKYIYFVAKPGASRGSQFSATLSEHLRAVAEYRRGNAAQPANGTR